MKQTLYFFDPITLRPTGKTQDVTVNLESGVSIYSLSPQELWEVSGQTGEVQASMWEPPSEPCIFDGHGWTPLRSLDAALAAHLMENQRISIHRVLELDLEAPVFDQIKTSIESNLVALGDQLSSKYPSFERESWSLQLVEAKNFIDSGAEAPLLSSIAEAEGRSIEDIALSVIDKSEKRTADLTSFTVLANRVRAGISKSEEVFTQDPEVGLQALLELHLQVMEHLK